jgi:hypothetical protein
MAAWQHNSRSIMGSACSIWEHVYSQHAGIEEISSFAVALPAGAYSAQNKMKQGAAATALISRKQLSLHLNPVICVLLQGTAASGLTSVVSGSAICQGRCPSEHTESYCAYLSLKSDSIAQCYEDQCTKVQFHHHHQQHQPTSSV